MRCPWLLCGALLIALAPPLAAQAPKGQGKAQDRKVFHVPYRLTDSQHIMVRLKINGKGPYNFIVDTGAPLLYVSIPIAEKAGVKADKKGTGTISKLEIEGGPVLRDFQCHVETPFQLTGMNAFGMAGVELHGMIGYTVLSHYKLEIDFTRDKMVWTKLNYQPPAPIKLGLDKKDKTLNDLDNVGKFMQGMAKFTGMKPPPPPTPRGFLGVELKEANGAVQVKAMLAKGPAADSGLKAGDRITAIKGEQVKTVQEVLRQAAKLLPGQELMLTVERGGKTVQITLTAGEGL